MGVLVRLYLGSEHTFIHFFLSYTTVLHMYDYKQDIWSVALFFQGRFQPSWLVMVFKTGMRMKIRPVIFHLHNDSKADRRHPTSNLPFEVDWYHRVTPLGPELHTRCCCPPLGASASHRKRDFSTSPAAADGAQICFHVTVTQRDPDVGCYSRSCTTFSRRKISPLELKLKIKYLFMNL